MKEKKCEKLFLTKKMVVNAGVKRGLLSQMASAGNSMMTVTDADYPASYEQKEALANYCFTTKSYPVIGIHRMQVAIIRSQRPAMAYLWKWTRTAGDNVVADAAVTGDA